MDTGIKGAHLIKAHNETKNGLNLRTARSKQQRISETPLFTQPSRQTDLFKNIPENK